MPPLMAGRGGFPVDDPIAARLAKICGIGIWETDQFQAALFALLYQLHKNSPEEYWKVADHWSLAQKIWLDSAAPEPRIH